MDFGLSAAQTLLQHSVRDYLRREVPLERVRSLLDRDSAHDRSVLAGLGDQGILGLLVPESRGGAGLSLLDAVVAAQELGRALTPLSFHSSGVMAPLLLAHGCEEQQSLWLGRIARGQALLSVALGAPVPRCGALDGEVRFVPDCEAADAFLVQTGTGPLTGLYLVPRETSGLSARPLHTVDETRRVGVLRFEELQLHEDMQLLPDEGAPHVERVVDAGRIALAADVLGASQKALEMAVEYSLEREQFGRVIGSFQAVKHMCAEIAAEMEPLQSLLWYAAWAWDEEGEDASHVAALLKAHATEVGTRTMSVTTQVFGGVGFTWECDLHFYFKRAAFDRQILGGPAELRQIAARSFDQM